MKLKNMLIIAFLVLTIIPIVIASLLLYNSGLNLSKESYIRNLVESLNVQATYISQSMEANVLSDYRFASKTITSEQITDESSSEGQDELYTAITSYLATAEDKISVCLLLDQEHMPIYSIGEKRVMDVVREQLPKPAEFKNQEIIEFDLGDGTHSLGILTPVWKDETYSGCMVSVYDKSYIFKSISSYYEIADTSTYICRENGDIINSRQLSAGDNETIQAVLKEITFSDDNTINTRVENTTLSGYYKNINNTPWYLVGFVDDALIYSFTNQFLFVYILIILGILAVDIVLAFYFSRKVVKPINNLVKVMESYHNGWDGKELMYQEDGGYVETKFLRTKFLELMKKILLVQHNFEGVYQLYQSNDMGDINIDIDVSNQTISSNKQLFQTLLDEIEVPDEACVVERFTRCFCAEDQRFLMSMLEEMRDEHLSVTQEIEICTPHLGEKWFHTLVVPMYTNERLSRLFIQLRDVSNFKRQEMESSEQAKRDVLTGLYNRAGFMFNVEKELLKATGSDLHALLFIDMNYFKMVNDNFGHATGDELLQSIGKTLLDVAGQKDIVSRFGGDEFVLFLTRTSQAEIAKMECTIKEQLFYPFSTNELSFVVSASIGVSTWTHDSPNTLKELLDQADTAMYKAKRVYKESANA